MNSLSPRHESDDFSLVLGGPLYQLYLRTRLVRPPLDLLRRRILALTLIAWLPLLVLSIVAGTAWSGVRVPFLCDLSTQSRLLGSLPLLVWAELVAHRWIKETVRQFVDQELIAPEDRDRFEDAVAIALRIRNSLPLELFLLSVALIGGHWLWKEQFALQVNTWYGSQAAGGLQLSVAGYWFAFVSLPLVRFVLLRWYFRLAIWYAFLWRVSRISLRLNPLHPDRSGGLGFLGHSVFAFGPIYVAHSLFLAGSIADRIWYEAAALPHFKMEIAGLLAFLMLLALTPLCFFALSLERAKRAGRREYSILASRYVNKFRRKWTEGDQAPQADLLGHQDIQGLSDLLQSFGIFRQTHPLPIDRNEVLSLAALIVLPLTPLVLTMVPVDELLDRLVKILL